VEKVHDGGAGGVENGALGDEQEGLPRAMARVEKRRMARVEKRCSSNVGEKNAPAPIKISKNGKGVDVQQPIDFLLTSLKFKMKPV
jgi:hypothetical protein